MNIRLKQCQPCPALQLFSTSRETSICLSLTSDMSPLPHRAFAVYFFDMMKIDDGRQIMGNAKQLFIEKQHGEKSYEFFVNPNPALTNQAMLH